jgi:hypothetical protein
MDSGLVDQHMTLSCTVIPARLLAKPKNDIIKNKPIRKGPICDDPFS